LTLHRSIEEHWLDGLMMEEGAGHAGDDQRSYGVPAVNLL
jgi:hypothetical protein